MTPFQVLGISEHATLGAAREARRKLLADLHPDRLPRDLPAEARRAIDNRRNEINTAFDQVEKIIHSKNSQNNEESSQIIKRTQQQPAANTAHIGCGPWILAAIMFFIAPPVGIFIFAFLFLSIILSQ